MRMPYVIADPCIATCDAACVDACPVDAIHGPPDARARKLQLYIDPSECICCAACEPVCPVRAIFDEDEVPDAWRDAVGRNAAFFGR